jgi:CBS domain-containing protein
MGVLDTPVKEFLTRAEGQLISEAESAAEAASMLANLGTGCVLVEREGKLAGIFTERDFLVRIVAQAKDPNAIAVRDVMTPEPECVEEWTSVAYAINRMAIGGYRNVPVVTKDQKPLGVVTIFDVIDYLMDLFKEKSSGPSETDNGEGDWLDIGGG